jgi:uncharacterized Zn finger protein
MRSPTTRRSRADTLKQVLDRQALRRLAGATSFERGTAYFASDQVGGLTSDNG